jgi:hypothetical protein
MPIPKPPVFTPNPQGIIHPGEAGYVAPGATSQGLDLASILRALRIARRGQTAPPAPLDDVRNERPVGYPTEVPPVVDPGPLTDDPRLGSFPPSPQPRTTAPGFYRDPNGVLTPKGPVQRRAWGPQPTTTQRDTVAPYGWYRDKQGRLTPKGRPGYFGRPA